jgi:alpha/beta superfamily hydrolase
VGLTAGQPVLFPSDGISLEGLLHLPEGDGPFPGAVICHPHPQYGGDMHNNVVGALVRACLDSGIAALRFNFRGVGASKGSYEGGAGELKDVAAAVDCLKSEERIDASRVVLVGYSFGALMALRHAAASPGLGAVIAVSPPAVAGPFVGIFIEPPLLLVAGDRDEYCDTGVLASYREKLGRNVQLEVVPGVDHFWWGSDDRLAEIVTGFIAGHLATR